VLQEICEHDWIKERCFHEGDNLLKANQLLEPALGRRAQNLLHIICYPQSHDLRKQNEQSSTKDFIRNILQNLDIWTLRESLLEFKLMIELEKQKERNTYYVRIQECSF
jgi:mediator of RNA polymerase II transcription subunit 12